MADLLSPVELPAPPETLGPAEAEVWRAVHLACGPGHIPAHAHDLLRAYCRRVIAAEQLAAVREKFFRARIVEPEGSLDPETVKEFARLQRLELAETAALSSLATKLRISPSAIKADRRKGPVAVERKPWES